MKKEFVFALFSAFAGSAITLLIDSYSNLTLSSWIIFASILLLMTLCLVFLGPIQHILSFRRYFTLRRNYISQWSYFSNQKKVTITDRIEVRQWGVFFSGKGQSSNIDGPHPFDTLNYKIQGHITRDGYINGKWENTDKDRKYFGTFLGKSKGKKLIIRWLGTSDRGVNSGTWVWKPA